MNLANATRDLSFRERAIHAATAAKLTSFAEAYDLNPNHVTKVNATFSKTCAPLTRFATLCDPTVVKQLAFVMPSFKMQVLTCPFPTKGRNDDEVFAGSLGDSMDVFCPVTIRMKDVCGDLLSICETRAEADAFKLPTSASNPLEENAPPNDDEFVDVEAEVAGPDRIGIELNVATKDPCFVAIPKVIPVTGGETAFSEFVYEPVTATATMPTVEPGSMTAIWYEAMRYGIRKLDNLSLQAKDVLFRYETLGKEEFVADNRKLVSRFTTIVTYLNPEDALYHEVIKRIIEAKEHAMLSRGTKILESAPPEPAVPIALDERSGIAGIPQDANPLSDRGSISDLLDGLAKAITSSSTKVLTGTERDKVSEAEDATRFYSILFGSVHQVIEEDESFTPTFVQATLHNMFEPVLTANKNSKATKSMQEAIESMATELSDCTDCYAAQSNLVPGMFDQPLTAALRIGQWEHQHTVLNPGGVSTNVGLHHLAPIRVSCATYRTRQYGELQLTQQEQVEETTSRRNAKTTDLYHYGMMNTSSHISEMVGNFYGLMRTIIVFDASNPPLIWTEIAKFMKIMRTNDGRRFAGRHRDIEVVMFNIGQEIQSIIVGFVSEARKTQYKTAIKQGNPISPQIFDLAQQQAAEVRSRFTLAVLAANAGTYKDTTAIYKLFHNEPTKDHELANRKKREASNEAFGTPSSKSTRSTRQTNSSSPSANTVTPNGSPAASSTTSPPGKTVFVHASPVPQRLPHPGPIFPHPTKDNAFTVLCCRSAYEGRKCTIPNCVRSHYHFPKQLNQVPRDLKQKLKDWVATQELVSWHPDAAKWADPPGNVAQSRSTTASDQ